ncbi:MAG: anti-sigma factor family protein [Chthoniobacterales bacterium]
MKNFEERYTAWLDGAMDAGERVEFEAALPDREAALRDAESWRSLSGMMRESLAPSAMPHGDFLNSQVLAQIERETPAPREPARRLFPVGWLAWSGALLLTVAALLSVLVVPNIRRGPTNEQFISQVVKARAGNPDLGASAFAAPGGKGTVLWVEDAGYIPADEEIK